MKIKTFLGIGPKFAMKNHSLTNYDKKRSEFVSKSKLAFGSLYVIQLFKKNIYREFENVASPMDHLSWYIYKSINPSLINLIDKVVQVLFHYSLAASPKILGQPQNDTRTTVWLQVQSSSENPGI